MFDREIARLAARLGWSDAERRAVEDLVARAAALPPSSLDTLIVEVGPDGVPVGPTPLDLPAERYAELGPIATGGMGEVLRVRDGRLGRALAMKVIKRSLADNPKIVARFVEEARTTAQLQHPNIVPVHDLGELDDGRHFFTMKEVEGETLTEVIGRVHACAGHGVWGVTDDGWSLRRLVDVFHKTCLAVAYAHDRGVVHRDLKPDNVMVGRFGEVVVMDWGLAKVIAASDEPLDVDPVLSAERRIAGTPSYMSPEQAWGEVVDVRSDVYSLGACLYEILCGRPPYEGDARAVIREVRRGPPAPLPMARRPAFAETRAYLLDDLRQAARDLDRPPVPAELAQLCGRAMAREAADRPADAAVLAEELEAWLDGASKRDGAVAIVDRAEQLAPRAEGLRAEARALRERAREALAAVRRSAPEDAKAEGWALEDRASELEQEADLLELDMEGMLRGALATSPGLPEAHAALARHHRAVHAAAEEARDVRLAARAEVLLRAHAQALPDDHPDREEHLAYLQGDGELSVPTEPERVDVRVYRYEPSGRRLVAVLEQERRQERLERLRLPMGSYLLVLGAEGRAEVRYPVEIRRQHVWAHVAPGASRPDVLRLPDDDELGPHDVLVPAGWFVARGLGEARRRWWADAFVIRRHPVTNAEYIAFLDDLVLRGREDEALACAPRENDSGEGRQKYGRDAEGRFVLVPDDQGDLWQPDWPVVLVDWASARAYARWLAERTGQPWRLPSAWEWEKAARGVDGRAYPWGDAVDASWFSNIYAHEERPLPSPVDAFPLDASPYGVRGMAGNVTDWCLEAFDTPLPEDGARLEVVEAEEAGFRYLRGGSWQASEDYAHLGRRMGVQPEARLTHVGFRVARSWDG